MQKVFSRLKFVANIFFMAMQFPVFNIHAQQPVSHMTAKSASLFDAIRSGDTGELERQLANGGDPNDSLNGFSALMACALNGSLEQMKILLAHGAKVNSADRDSITALWYAVPDWNKTVLLLEHGANPKPLSKEGYGILVKLALIPGTAPLFQLLINKGADPKHSAPDNFLLYNAAASGDTTTLGMLIRLGLDVNGKVAFGDFPINAALLYRNFPAVKMLVENGADVNTRMKPFAFASYNGLSTLMYAALVHDKPSFLYLLEHGADPNLRSTRGFTALMLLQQSETDDPEMTLALIHHGAIISEKATDGSDALYYAQRNGNAASEEILKQYVHK